MAEAGRDVGVVWWLIQLRFWIKGHRTIQNLGKKGGKVTLVWLERKDWMEIEIAKANRVPDIKNIKGDGGLGNKRGIAILI
jgi:hypothetical protein